MDAREQSKNTAYSILKKYISFTSHDEIEKLAVELLDNKIKNIRRGKLLEQVLRDLPTNRYDNFYERYLFKRNYDGQKGNVRDLYPYGFLLNLSYRHYYSEGCILINQEEEIKEVREISKALYLLKEKSYSIYEFLFSLGPDSFTEDISNYISNFYEGYFPQYSLKFIELLIERVLQPYFVKADKLIEFEIVKSLIQEIKKDSSLTNLEINYKKIYKKFKSKISKVEFYKFIDLLSYTEKKKEEKYELLHLNYLFIKDKEKYVIPVRSMNIFGLYTQLYLFLDKFIEKLSFKIGEPLEQLVYNSFKDKGIECYKGHWIDEESKKHYECDLVLNLPNTIVLIEIKKASMTLGSKKREDFYLLKDIEKSLLKSQLQALRHRERLERKQVLELTKIKGVGCNPDYKIELKNKKIVTLSLTLEDFDILHGSLLCRNLLKSTFSIRNISTIPKQKEEKTLNKTISDLKGGRFPQVSYAHSG